MYAGKDNYSELMEQLPDAYAYHKIITDHNGTPVDYIFLYVNRAFEELFSLTKNQMVGKKITEVFSNIKASSYDWIKSFSQVAISGESLHIEQYYKLKDGWYEITSYSHAPGFFAVIFRDITERRRAEEALKESQQRLETIIRDVPDIIYRLDQKGRIIFISDAVRDYSYAPAEMIGTNMLDYVHPEDREKAAYKIKERRTGERRTRAFQIRLLPKESRPRYAEVKSGVMLEEPVFLLEAEGLYPHDEISARSFVGTHGVIRDITERKLLEEAFQESNRRYRELFEGSRDGFVVVDIKGRFLDANASYCSILGYSLDELKEKKDFYAITPERWRKWEYDEIWCNRLWKTGSSGVYEKEYIRKDGTVFPVELQSFTVLDDEGAVRYLWGIVRDITDRKRMELYRTLSSEVLGILTESASFHDSIQRILKVLKQRTGFDAVGMRLQSGDDFPYYVQHGFSEDFLRVENSLVARDPNGDICRNSDGSISLECTCGLIISGKTDPSNPLFTPGGSCWTNDSFPLLELPSINDLRLHPRNQCIHKGFASVAQIPIRKKQQIVGILQLNDRRKGQFNLDVINILEGIANHIGEALIRKQAEQQLQERENRYRALVEGSYDAVTIMNREGRFIDCNHRAVELFGLQDKGEFVTCTPVDLSPDSQPDGRSSSQAAFEYISQAIEKGLSRFEWVHQRKNGEIFPTEIILVSSKIGEEIVIHSTVRDYTDYKKAEEALRQSEERFRIAFHTSPDLINLNRISDGMFLEANDAFLQVLGYEREEVIGHTSGELNIWANPGDRARLVEKLKTDGFVADLEAKFFRKDGTIRIGLMSASVIRLGEEACYLSITRDVTERKQAEEALHHRDQEFRALAENAPDIVARFDRNLRYLYVNPAVVKHTGIPREQFIDRTSEELNMPLEQTRLRNTSLMDVFQSGEEKDMYYEHVTPSGRKYYHSRLAPEFGPDGTVETVLSIARDITAIKEMESVLQQERSKTRQIHLRSLPDELPVIPGLALAACYKASPKLQGDYYNAICRGNQLLLYLVDIQGTRDDGVMQSFFVRKYIEGFLSYRDVHEILSPALLLRNLAEQYQQDNNVEKCPLCIFLAVFDMHQMYDRGELRYASMGYCTPPLVIAHVSDPIELIVDRSDNSTGKLHAYQEHSFVVAPGSLFVFSTNGLFKQGFDQGSFEPRFREVCYRHYHLPPELISQAIDADFADFSNTSPLEEDIAYLVVQVSEKEQHLSFKVESDIHHAEDAKEKVASFLASHYEQRIDLLTFHELLVNAMEHGNKRDGGKSVSVDVAVTGRYYKIRIIDQGEGFNWREKINRELDLSGDSDRGRGIIMTRMMTDYLGYNERGNRATMINLID